MSHRTYFPKRGDFIHFNASPSAGQETAGPHFALVMSPVSYSRKTGMAIVLIGTKSKDKPMACTMRAFMATAKVISVEKRDIKINE